MKGYIWLLAAAVVLLAMVGWAFRCYVLDCDESP